MPEKYVPPNPPPLPADYDEFYASLTQTEKDLIEVAREKLQSSFFIQWTHMYKKWQANRKI
jgi:hypothetical protein